MTCPIIRSNLQRRKRSSTRIAAAANVQADIKLADCSSSRDSRKRRRLHDENLENTQQNLFLRLSDEEILHIFASLHAADLATCLRVSSRWRRLALDNSLWRKLYFEDIQCGLNRPLSMWTLELITQQNGFPHDWRILYKIQRNWICGCCAIRRFSRKEGCDISHGSLVRVLGDKVFFVHRNELKFLTLSGNTDVCDRIFICERDSSSENISKHGSTVATSLWVSVDSAATRDVKSEHSNKQIRGINGCNSSAEYILRSDLNKPYRLLIGMSDGTFRKFRLEDGKFQSFEGVDLNRKSHNSANVHVDESGREYNISTIKNAKAGHSLTFKADTNAISIIEIAHLAPYTLILDCEQRMSIFYSETPADDDNRIACYHGKIEKGPVKLSMRIAECDEPRKSACQFEESDSDESPLNGKMVIASVIFPQTLLNGRSCPWLQEFHLCGAKVVHSRQVQLSQAEKDSLARPETSSGKYTGETQRISTLSYAHPYVFSGYEDNTMSLRLVHSTSAKLELGLEMTLFGHNSSVKSAQVDSLGRAVSVALDGVRLWKFGMLEQSNTWTDSLREHSASEERILRTISQRTPQLMYSARAAMSNYGISTEADSKFESRGIDTTSDSAATYESVATISASTMASPSVSASVNATAQPSLNLLATTKTKTGSPFPIQTIDCFEEIGEANERTIGCHFRDGRSLNGHLYFDDCRIVIAQQTRSIDLIVMDFTV